jgi:hypothetical protein
MQTLSTTDKASRRATAEQDPGHAGGTPAAAVPAMDLAPLRAAPQGRSLEVRVVMHVSVCSTSMVAELGHTSWQFLDSRFTRLSNHHFAAVLTAGHAA